MELDVWNARVVELEPRATKLDKQLGQSSLLVHVAEPKHPFLFDET